MPEFSRSLFGYDAAEVQAALSRMRDQLEHLEARRELGTGDGAGRVDLGAEIDSAVPEIAELLEAARTASRRIRERAEQEAADRLAGVGDQVRRTLAKAESDAFALRKSAWDTSTELLEEMKAEAARIRSTAEREALEIIGEAERKAHPKLAAARRDSDSAAREASAEGERLLGMARARAKQIIRAAESRAEFTNERVSVLEKRHEELSREVEIFLAVLDKLPSTDELADPSTARVITPPPADQEGDRQAGVRPAVDTGPATAVTIHARSTAQNGGDGNGDGPPRAWADGTSNVRLVEIPRPTAQIEVDALELADEVALLRNPDSGRTPSVSTGSGDNGGHGGSARTQPSRVSSSSSRTARYQEPEAAPAGGTVRGPTKAPSTTLERSPSDDLGGLFLERRLRQSTDAAGSAEVSVASPHLSQVEIYERRLRPITDRAQRAVKRELIDLDREQTGALEAGNDGWIPRRSRLAHPLIHVLGLMEREAFERGHRAAAELTGTFLPTPRQEAKIEGSETFIADLFDQVNALATDAREDRTEREIVRDLSRAYRRWRTDEADPRLRSIAGQAYHRGLLSGLARAGVEKVRVVFKRYCTGCSELAGQVLSIDDVPAIPASDGCRCILLPA